MTASPKDPEFSLEQLEQQRKHNLVLAFAVLVLLGVLAVGIRSMVHSESPANTPPAEEPAARG